MKLISYALSVALNRLRFSLNHLSIVDLIILIFKTIFLDSQVKSNSPLLFFHRTFSIKLPNSFLHYIKYINK